MGEHSKQLLAMGVVCVLCAAPSRAAAPSVSIPGAPAAVLKQHCYSCHGPKKQKGKLRLDTMGRLDPSARLDLLNKIQEQLHFNEMPPEEAKAQPTPAQKSTLVKWVEASGKIALPTLRQLCGSRQTVFR